MKREYILFGIVMMLISCKKKMKYYYPTGELFSIVEVNNEGVNDGSIKKMYKTGQLEGIGYYVNGKKEGVFKEFFKSGKLKSIENFENGTLIDTSKIYYSNGNLSIKKYFKDDAIIFQENFSKNGLLRSKGEIKDTLRVNWWNYYSNEKIKNKTQYLLINNKEYVNQVYHYDDYGNIVRDSSNFYTINFPDTIEINRLVKGSLKLTPYLSKQNNSHKVFFKYFNLNQNEDKPLESTYGTNEKEALLWAKFDSKGKKRIEGYILEDQMIFSENKKDTTMNDIQSIEHKMFFYKDIYVIGNVPN